MKNIYREYLHIPKDKHITTKVFTTHVVLSVISVLACTLAMFATSYAWFSMEISSETNIIAAANFAVNITEASSVQVIAEDEWSHEESGAEYVADLAEMDEHRFYIEPIGTATTGYCMVSLTYEGDTQVYYTQQMSRESYLELTISARKGTEIVISPYWGDLDFHGVDYEARYGTVKSSIATFGLRRRVRVEDGATIPGPATPYLEYQFPQYAMLEDVAEFYEIDMADILIFNGIEDPAEIEIGDWINLPYVDEDAEIYVALPPDIEHEVQEGETVESIAALYDIGIDELVAYNGLKQYEGDEILTGEENTDTEDENEEEEPVYLLTPGDILLIPYYAETGFTNPDTVREEDFIGKEPGYFEEDEPVDEPVDEPIYEPWFEPVDEGGEPADAGLNGNEEEEAPNEPEMPAGVLVNGDIEQNEPEQPEQTEQPTEEPSGVLQLG